MYSREYNPLAPITEAAIILVLSSCLWTAQSASTIPASRVCLPGPRMLPVREYPTMTGQPASNTGQPLNNTGQPANDTGQPSSNAGQPLINTGQLVNNTGEPVNNTGPTCYTEQPTNNSGHAANNARHPASIKDSYNIANASAHSSGGTVNAQITVSGKTSSSDADQQHTVNAVQPANNTGNPASITGQPVNTTGHPESNAGQPASNTGQPTSNTGQPANNTGQPARNAGQAAGIEDSYNIVNASAHSSGGTANAEIAVSGKTSNSDAEKPSNSTGRPLSVPPEQLSRNERPKNTTTLFVSGVDTMASKLPVQRSARDIGKQSNIEKADRKCLIFGDSISIGYTPYVTKALKDKCTVYHAPWDVRDGGALDSSHGLDCLDISLSSSLGLPVVYDVIVFNFGLHDIDCSGDMPEEYTSAENYSKNLSRLKTLLASKAGDLAFVLTTPVLYNCTMDDSVKAYNTIAMDVMRAEPQVPVIDLYNVVIDQCGAPPYKDLSNCLIADPKPSPHYTPRGYALLATHVTEAIEGMLDELHVMRHMASDGDVKEPTRKIPRYLIKVPVLSTRGTYVVGNITVLDSAQVGQNGR
ncbi:predicted protein [Nematostella vectensis]|uniref:SGNH hydrolase-type esterase domain-containing protein n=1 Tax=Nematostella vectensis TaxID=45351 RepID=A7RLH2_NEMVE|nr:predicted protein [Nematostella vectensis]|eukprot:XP_001639667.1 predicted protein [Nematostella vectensis]